MSWQSYIDTQLLGTGKIAKAAILGLQGGVWASSEGYHISPEQQTAIIEGFNKPDSVQSTGLRLADTKFIVISVEGRTIRVKHQANGGTIVKTKQAVIVAEYTAPTQAPEVDPIVERLADYLIEQKY
ncbi:hypothetical protein D9613_012592 [Agrocybe pediades]|uniref:Profilin n=1 Tax=Agrocybe pediades TaxID=84607 RepID=A0A8H4R1G7_9AGAR|nr:hypothetical protein D9613_012592 [Agrocybe pediades]KAF9555378.1 profilin [Agrocybe pediades]